MDPRPLSERQRPTIGPRYAWYVCTMATVGDPNQTAQRVGFAFQKGRPPGGPAPCRCSRGRRWSVHLVNAPSPAAARRDTVAIPEEYCRPRPQRGEHRLRTLRHVAATSGPWSRNTGLMARAWRSDVTAGMSPMGDRAATVSARSMLGVYAIADTRPLASVVVGLLTGPADR